METVQPQQRKVLDANTVVKVFKEIHIPSVEELVEKIGRRYKRLKPRRRGLKGRIEFEVKRVELVRNILVSTIDQLLKLPRLEQMNMFHRLLVESIYGDEYNKALEKLRFARKLIEQFWDDYRLLILTAEDAEEAAKLRKEACGRMISVWRRLKKYIDLLIKVKEEIVKTHVVSEDLPVVVVAGVPSAGKSTFIREVSTAEPEVAAYPFTTKTVIVGKATCGRLQVYFVDTPGLLDRLPEEQNPIERKAVVAIKALAHALVFLVDVSVERTLDVERQFRVFDYVRSVLGDKPTLLVLSKYDYRDEEAVKKAIAEAEKRGFKPIPMSIPEKLNVDYVFREACRMAIERYFIEKGLTPRSLT